MEYLCADNREERVKKPQHSIHPSIHILLLITALTIGDVWSICVLIIEKKGLKSPNILFIPLSLTLGQTYIKKSDTSKK